MVFVSSQSVTGEVFSYGINSNYAEKYEGTNYKGDIIFAKVVDDTIVNDFVAFRGDAY